MIVEHELILMCVCRCLDLQVMTSFVDMLLGKQFRQRATDLGCYHLFLLAIVLRLRLLLISGTDALRIPV